MNEPEMIPCPACNGEGGWEHPTNQPNWYGEDMEWIKCEDCAGTGEVELVQPDEEIHHTSDHPTQGEN